LKTAKEDEKENELQKKHDARIKVTMKRALTAMRTVDSLVRGHQREDPTVKAADKAVIKARGAEIFTVLGLDHKQLTKDYLLSMDAAVAAYNSMPDAHSEEKMEKALEVTKERVQKEKIIEMKKKKEVKAKKVRSAQNSAYYKAKWVEKTRELKKKKTSRDKFVHKIKSENKFKLWVTEQRENEGSHKKKRFDTEAGAKTKKEKDHKVFRSKVAAANAKIKETREKKFNAEQKTWEAKLTAAKNDYQKKKEEEKVATEARDSTRSKMTTIRLNSKAAAEKAASAQKAVGLANELKTKFSSEANQKAAQDKQALADAAKETASEADFKLKEILTTMTEKDKKQSQAKIKAQEALVLREKVQEQHDTHAATRDDVVRAEPPPTVDEGSEMDKLSVDPADIMKAQMAEMKRSMPLPPRRPSSALSAQSAMIQKGASLKHPAGDQALHYLPSRQ